MATVFLLLHFLNGLQVRIRIITALLFLIALPTSVSAASCLNYDSNFANPNELQKLYTYGDVSIENNQLVLRAPFNDSDTGFYSRVIQEQAFSAPGGVLVTAEINDLLKSNPRNQFSIREGGFALLPENVFYPYVSIWFQIIEISGTIYSSISVQGSKTQESETYDLIDEQYDFAYDPSKPVRLSIFAKNNYFEFRFSHGDIQNQLVTAKAIPELENKNFITTFDTYDITALYDNPGVISKWNSININCRQPVYRFWSDQKQTHFYTIDENEKEAVINNYDDFVWKYEGPRFNAIAYNGTCPVGHKPVFRFWSDKNQRHFYTIDAEERDTVVRTMSDVWNIYEGPRYCAVDNAAPQITDYAKAPIYRFWSDSKLAHFYTIDESERNTVINTLTKEWNVYEGPRYFAYPL